MLGSGPAGFARRLESGIVGSPDLAEDGRSKPLERRATGIEGHAVGGEGPDVPARQERDGQLRNALTDQVCARTIPPMAPRRESLELLRVSLSPSHGTSDDQRRSEPTDRRSAVLPQLGDPGQDEPVDLRAHRQRAASQHSSFIMTQGPTDGRPGNAIAESDVPLRLAAWLAAVSQEAALTAPAPGSPTPARLGTETRPTPRSVH